MTLSIRELDYIADEIADRLKDKIKREDTILTAPQVAEMLGLTRQAVWKQVRKGVLPCVRRGHRYYFSKKEIIRLLTTSKTT